VEPHIDTKYCLRNQALFNFFMAQRGFAPKPHCSPQGRGKEVRFALIGLSVILFGNGGCLKQPHDKLV